MINKSHYNKKHYSSAKDRFLKPAIKNFFKNEFSGFMGPIICNNAADEITKIVEKLYPKTDRLKPGQVFWNALDKRTRADSPNRKYVPVVLTLISENDIKQLEKGVSMQIVRQNTIARIIEEAYEQGGLLSMRDISLLILQCDSNVSTMRKQYEKRNNRMLPHTGNLHDMGSCITHKIEIVYKVIVEKKDPISVARETKHSQRAVDHYLQDYYRVRTVYKENQDTTFISMVTNISKNVVNQYIELIKKYE